MPCTNCKKKNNTVEKMTVTKDETATVSKFKMRNNTGVHQISFGSGLFISNGNLTDELAFDFLKENPNRISLFEVFPEDWKELLNGENEAKKETVQTTKDKSVKRKSK